MKKTVKQHEKQYYHLDKQIINRGLVWLGGLGVFSYWIWLHSIIMNAELSNGIVTLVGIFSVVMGVILFFIGLAWVTWGDE